VTLPARPGVGALLLDESTPVTDEALIGALPDLVAFIRRDGVVLDHLGGRSVPGLGNLSRIDGQHVETIWPAPLASLLVQLTRRALTSRSSSNARFVEQGTEYEARISPHGRDRVLCVIRNLTGEQSAAGSGAGGDRRPPAALGRRGFLGRFKQSVADATLRDRTLAVCVIHLDGLADIARVIDFNISDQLATAMLQRLPDSGADPGADKMRWYVGQLGDGLLAAVVEGSPDREAIGAVLQALCTSLQEPVSVGDATFHLTPHAGVAILGRDALTAQLLLDHARAAALESRRNDRPGIHFYSDTIRLRSLARLDVAHELRRAIADRDVQLRYVGRHDLASGRLTALVAYLYWPHPLRGAVRPAEFVAIAEHTGLATALSRAALARLSDDWPALRTVVAAGVRISFSALRHHLAGGGFPEDVAGLFEPGALTPEDLELRISERTLSGLPAPERTFRQLVDSGVRLVVDEVGRGGTSIASLAQLPLHGLQLDRACVVAADQEPSALRICRAAIGMATGLELIPIATGIDNEQRRACLVGLGCKQGLGDLYAGDFRSDADSPLLEDRRRSVR
jgi:diguanylate cyclase